MNFTKKVLFVVFIGCSIFIGALIQSGLQKISAQSKPEHFICSKYSLETTEEFLNKNCNPNKSFMGTGMGQDLKVCCVAK